MTDKSPLMNEPRLQLPRTVQWLERKLTRRLGNVERWVLETKMVDIYDLSEDDPDSLGQANQDDLIWDMKELIKQELADADKSPVAIRIGEISGSNLAVDDQGSPLPPPRTSEFVDLLSDVERECAAAVAAYTSAVLNNHPSVLNFRRTFLDNKCLSIAEADDFIRSPAVRLLSPDDWKELSLRSLESATEIEWEAGFIAHEDLEELLEDASVINFAKARKRYYNSYTTVIKVNDQTVRQMLVGQEDSLKCIPFLPLDANPNDTDGSFPWMFPGSVAAVLGQLSESLSMAFSIDAWQIALLMICGERIRVEPVKLVVFSPSLQSGANSGVSHETVYFARTDTRTSLAGPARGFPHGFIRIEALPWVTPDTISRYYAHYRSELLDLGEGNDRIGIKETVRRGEGQQKRRKFRLPEARLVRAIAAVAEMYTNDPSKMPRLSAVQQSKDKNKAKLYSADYSNFVTAYKRISATLDLPWNIHQLLKRYR